MRRDHRDDDWQPDMPPIEVGGYLAGYLFEIGPTMPGGMGAAPITNQEIESWQRLARITLAPWEARFLRRLSRDYIGESHKAEKRGAEAPWSAGDERIDRAVQNDAQKNAWRAVAAV